MQNRSLWLMFGIIGLVLGVTALYSVEYARACSLALPENLQPERLSGFPKGVHMYRIPAKTAQHAKPLLFKQPQTLHHFGEQSNVALAINGGYFDPKNGQSVSWVVLDGKTVADPNTNTRLATNQSLKPYWPKILNRGELRFYQCYLDATDGPIPTGSRSKTKLPMPELQLDITRHNAPIPSHCQLQHSLGAGPVLLPNPDFAAEGFTATNAAGKLIRDPISVNRRKARSAVGITKEGDLLVLLVQQGGATPKVTGLDKYLPQAHSVNPGTTLAEVTDYLKQAGAVKGLNLDGGSSSQLFVSDLQKPSKIVPGRIDGAGRPGTRKILSVLTFQKSP